MKHVCLLLSLSLLGAQGLPKQLADFETNRGDVDLKIDGGNAVSIEQIPYQVSVMKYGSHYCGGTILTSQWILTAAECVYLDSDPTIISVRYGSATRDQDGTVVPSKWVGMHPQFDSDSLQWNLALIQLSSDIVFSTTAQPIKMMDVNSEPRSTDLMTVSGWGIQADGGASFTDQLYAVDVPYVPRTICSLAYSDDDDDDDDYDNDRNIEDDAICVGGQGKDACVGDNGGPVVSELGLLAGVISWGNGCGAVGYPRVCVNLASYGVRDYITNTTGLP